MSEDVKTLARQPRQPAEYMVVLRHSTVLPGFKTATVTATSEEEAKLKFLALAKAAHETRAQKLAVTPGMEPKECAIAAQRCRADYEEAEKQHRAGNCRWTVKLKADFDAEQKALADAQELRLAEMQQARTGQPVPA